MAIHSGTPHAVKFEIVQFNQFGYLHTRSYDAHNNQWFIFLHVINWLLFIVERDSILCEVRTTFYYYLRKSDIYIKSSGWQKIASGNPN
jgi:hypothetical protein